MSAAALALALSAAVVHALWNVLVGGARDPRPAAAMALLVAVTVGLPLAIVTWQVESGVVPWAIASAALELAYIVLLAAAYRGADVAVIYPVARGAAPVLVLALSVATGAATSAGQLAGVALVAGGIAIVGGAGAGATRRDLLLALGVAATIAGYTVVDKHGLRYAAPVPYLELVMVWPALIYAGYVAVTDGTGALRAAVGRSALIAGAGMFLAYALVLAALERAPAAAVSAVRESSIVIAPLLAAALVHQPLTRRTLPGAVLVAAGVALVALA